MYMCIDYKLHNKCKYSRACDISMHMLYFYAHVCAAYVHVCVYYVNTLIYYIHL